MDRRLCALVTSGIAAFVLAAAWDGSLAPAQGADATFDPAESPTAELTSELSPAIIVVSPDCPILDRVFRGDMLALGE